jgi:DNA topoisomerase I
MAKPKVPAHETAKHAARIAKLKLVSDTAPGIQRLKGGRSVTFRFRGRPVRSTTTLQRIRSLVIPPAWTDVWICRSPQGHIQATGRDARGRKQYKYHPRWREVRDQTKYERLASFGNVLPKIRARVRRDLARPHLPREKVLATVVRLMETTSLRVGNEEYVRSNGSYGLTTLRDRHVAVRGPVLRFCFRGKSGKLRDVELTDRRLARIVRRCRDLPGQMLFQYVDDTRRRRTVTSGDVNDYLREISGYDFTAKDFRTWTGTLLGARCLQKVRVPRNQREVKRRCNEVVHAVAEQLGNTDAVCRKSYIHPLVLEAVGKEEWLRRFIRGPSSGLATAAAWERFLVRAIKDYQRPRRAA